MKPSISHRIAVLALLVMLLGVFASAQYRAGVQGVVTDASGAVVPNATVTVTSEETNFKRTGPTSSAGVFSIVGLAPGHYQVTVEKEGFAKRVVENVVVEAEQVRPLNVQLSLAQAKQTVTVTSDTGPALKTESATIGETVTTKQVESLPAFGRDPFQLMLLAPGVFADNGRSAGGGSRNLPGNAGPGGTGNANIFQTENQVQVVANGTRNTSNSFLIDGVATNSLNWGGASVITPNTESIKEVRIDVNSYSAESSRAGGAQFQVVSKNGTNDAHGSAFFRAARPGLNAFQRWNGPTAKVQRVNDRFNQFGGSVGGPVLRNKLFAFFSYETQRLGTVNTGSAWFETAQFAKAVQAAHPNSIATRITGFPGEGASFDSISQTANCALANISPCANITDGSGKLIGLDIGSPLKLPLGTPDPGGATGSGGGLDGVPDVMFVNTLNPNKTRARQFNGRVDFQATEKDLIAFSTFQSPVNSEFFNGPARAANFWLNDRRMQSGTLLWNHIFSPTLLNEARFGASRWSWNEITSNPQEPWGLPTMSVDGRGTVRVQNFGAPGPGIFAQTTYNFHDIATWVHGSHTTKFGADVQLEQNNLKQPGGARPTFFFRNLWDFANDAPRQENGTFDPRTGIPSPVAKNLRPKTFGVFAQNDWRVRPNLTLNLGLRWEYFKPISETNDQLSNAVLGTGTNTLTGLRMKLGGNLFNASKNNLAPQIGFAWSPATSRLAVRGGFGIGFTRTEGAIQANAASNPPFVSSTTLTGNKVLLAVPNDVRQFFNWPANPATVLAIDPVTNLPATGGSLNLNIHSRQMRTPTTYRYSLDAQYDVGGHWVASVGYQGSQTRHYTRQRNLSWFFPQNLNPALRNVFFFSNDGNASYNALLTEIKHRFSRTFEVDAQYRWSKTIDTGSNEFNIGEYPFDLAFLRGPADFDVKHNLKLFGIWSPRLFGGSGWQEKVVGGWQVSGILNLHTGFPWTPVFNVPAGGIIFPGDGFTNLRPAAFLGGAGTDQGTDTFKRANGNFPGGAFKFFTAPTFSPGSIPPPPGVGRNSFRGPRYLGIDMALAKSFGLPKTKILGEAARFEFRTDFFNLFNKLNLVNPDNRISVNNRTTPNPLFGQSQGALAGRVINLQARFSF